MSRTRPRSVPASTSIMPAIPAFAIMPSAGEAPAEAFAARSSCSISRLRTSWSDIFDRASRIDSGVSSCGSAGAFAATGGACDVATPAAARRALIIGTPCEWRGARSAAQPVDALDAVPVRIDRRKVDLGDRQEIVAEPLELAEREVFALVGAADRAAMAREVIAERHEAAAMPDLEESRVFGRQPRMDLVGVDARDAVAVEHARDLAQHMRLAPEVKPRDLADDEIEARIGERQAVGRIAEGERRHRGRIAGVDEAALDAVATHDRVVAVLRLAIEAGQRDALAM